MTLKPSKTSLPELTAILLARLGFLWLLVLLAMLIPNDQTAFYAFMGIAFIITIPYSLWLRSKLRTTQFAPLQFIVDLILVTGLVYFTGGIQSDLTLLYPLVILSAGIVGTPRQSAEITVLAVIIYTLMATLLSNDWIVAYMPMQTSPAVGSTMALVLRGLMFVLFGIASIYISKRCNYIASHHRELADTTFALISGIPSPALLLDHEGYILFANDPFCKCLQINADRLAALRFSELEFTGRHPIPTTFERALYLKKEDGNPVPLTYESQDIHLLETALLGSNGRENTEITVTLLIFTDISQSLENIRQLEKVDRITAATQIAGEMAHEIRTPLTAISASVQLLRTFEESTSAADWLPNSPRRGDRKELFNHIEDASQQMDTVVDNFIRFAEFSPTDLLSIIKLDYSTENKGYIGQLNTLGSNTNGQNIDCG